MGMPEVKQPPWHGMAAALQPCCVEPAFNVSLHLGILGIIQVTYMCEMQLRRIQCTHATGPALAAQRLAARLRAEAAAKEAAAKRPATDQSAVAGAFGGNSGAATGAMALGLAAAAALLAVAVN